MNVFSLVILTWISVSWSRSLPVTDRNKRSAISQEVQAVASAGGGDPWPWDVKCPPHVIKGGCPYVGGPLLHKMSHGGRGGGAASREPCTTPAAARARCQLPVPGDPSTLQLPPMLTATLRDGHRVCVAWSRSYSHSFTLFKGWVSELTWLSAEGTAQHGRLASLSASFRNQLTDRATAAEVSPDHVVYDKADYSWDDHYQDEYVTLSGGNFTINDLGLTVYRAQETLLLSKLGNEFNYGEGIVGALGSMQAMRGGLIARSVDGMTYIKTRQTGECRLLLAKAEDIVNRVVSL